MMRLLMMMVVFFTIISDKGQLILTSRSCTLIVVEVSTMLHQVDVSHLKGTRTYNIVARCVVSSTNTYPLWWKNMLSACDSLHQAIYIVLGCLLLLSQFALVRG
jgi:hypothetical protein